jgi:hypothetical protein
MFTVGSRPEDFQNTLFVDPGREFDLVLPNIEYTIRSLFVDLWVQHDPTLPRIYINAEEVPVIEKVRESSDIDRIRLPIYLPCTRNNDDDETIVKNWRVHISIHGEITFVASLANMKRLVAGVCPMTGFVTKISPISCYLFWPRKMGDGDTKYEIMLEGMDDTYETSNNSMFLTNLEPLQTYQVTIRHGSDSYEVAFTTSGVFDTTYQSTLSEGSIHDLSGFSEASMAVLKKNRVLKPRDHVKVNGVTATVVTHRNAYRPAKGENIYLYSTCKGKQFICLEDEEKKDFETVLFDETEAFINVNGVHYTFGDNLSILGRKCTLVQGSLIIVFSDGYPSSFPFGPTVAAETLTGGDLIVRDIVCRNMYQIADKVNGGVTTGSMNFFVYDAVNKITLNTTTIEFSLNDAADTGSLELKNLYTTTAGVQSVDTSLAISPTEIVFQAQDTTTSLKTTMDSSGISFDSDDAAVYFGTNKTFRMYYTAASGNTPATLSIDGLSDTTGTYSTIWYISDSVSSTV